MLDDDSALIFRLFSSAVPEVADGRVILKAATKETRCPL
jgi:hypothetical protein